MSDRKHMKKIRNKRMKAVGRQINKHKEKIEHEKGRLDTTEDYWKKEIEDKLEKQIKEDKEYLEEN